MCSAILCNYSKLKQDSWGVFDTNTWYLMEAFDRIADNALKNYPMLEKVS